MCERWVKYLSAVVVLLSVNSVSCAQANNLLTNFLDVGFFGSKADKFEKCVTDANYTCLEELVRSKFHEFLDKDKFQIMENVVIERVADTPSDLQSENSRFGKKSGLLRKVRNFFSSRTVRVDFMDIFRLRMSKAAKFPEEVELSVEVFPETGETKISAKGGKGHRTAKIVVPLVIGFVMTGLGILAIATVKAILMKAFFVSTVAALTAIFLVIKKALENKHTPHEIQQQYYFAPQPIPYDTAYHPAEMAYGTPYNALSHYATINPTDDPWAAAAAAQFGATDTGYGGYSVSEHDTGSSLGIDVSEEDSVGQFSHIRPVTLSKMKRKAGTAGAFRGMIKLVKSQANRLPVLAYRHTGTGRKLT